MATPIRRTNPGHHQVRGHLGRRGLRNRNRQHDRFGNHGNHRLGHVRTRGDGRILRRRRLDRAILLFGGGLGFLAAAAVRFRRRHRAGLLGGRGNGRARAERPAQRSLGQDDERRDHIPDGGRQPITSLRQTGHRACPIGESPPKPCIAVGTCRASPAWSRTVTRGSPGHPRLTLAASLRCRGGARPWPAGWLASTDVEPGSFARDAQGTDGDCTTGARNFVKMRLHGRA